MRDSGVSGKVIMEKLIENSETFQEKKNNFIKMASFIFKICNFSTMADIENMPACSKF